VSLLAGRLLEVHDALEEGGFPHAFGGAIALAYCTLEPRGTRDLDVNVFVAPSRVAEVFAALPDAVAISTANIEEAERDGQVRLWWQDTPIDVFLNTLELHREVARGVRMVPFMERMIPVLDCTSVAIFKALFDRTKDWADVEAMVEAGKIDIDEAVRWIEQVAGAGAPEAQRMAALAQPSL
jgi:hypothetical protein